MQILSKQLNELSKSHSYNQQSEQKYPRSPSQLCPLSSCNVIIISIVSNDFWVTHWWSRREQSDENTPSSGLRTRWCPTTVPPPQPSKHRLKDGFCFSAFSHLSCVEYRSDQVPWCLRRTARREFQSFPLAQAAHLKMLRENTNGSCHWSRVFSRVFCCSERNALVRIALSEGLLHFCFPIIGNRTPTKNLTEKSQLVSDTGGQRKYEDIFAQQGALTPG